MQRRSLLLTAPALLAAATLPAWATTPTAKDLPVLQVWKDPNCGCCKDWISYLEANGFTVNDHVEANMPALKQRLGVAPRLASCHTGVIGGQFVEGHVPVAQILAMRQRPDLLGIAVPGMPVGSPGMEYGDRQDAYQVIGLTRSGRDRVLADYP